MLAIRAPDHKDRGYHRTNSDTSFIIEHDFVSDKPQMKSLLLQGTVRSINTGCLSTEYIEW